MKGVTVVVFLCLCALLVKSALLRDAEKCTSDNCSGSCRCSTQTSPLSEGDAPQLIALTIDESLVNNSYNLYWEPLLIGRKNPDGNPISGTFFVPHDYTDYQRVNKLYQNGFEIGVNSITKNSTSAYWLTASQETLVQEFQGQRTIISKFANIPIEDITGARTPMLLLESDVSIEAYIASGITYDSSWTAHHGSNIFPYTLDYLSSQECLTTTNCPVESHPGFWIAPIIDLLGNGSECNSLWNCNYQGTANEISTWLNDQVEQVRNANRAPIVLMLSSTFFAVENGFEGFQQFLDNLSNDVYLVSVKQIINWVQNPVPAEQFQTEVIERSAECEPVTCTLPKTDDGSVRYMPSCVPCPDVYPWLGNPEGVASSDL